MIELKNFPMRNQLADVRSADGKPAENAAYDCVPTCLAACIQWYTGRVVAADDLKDAVYGQGHVGGGSELRYGDLVKKRYGLALGYTALPSASQAIIDHIRAELRAGHPVIVTMHSQWSRLWNADGGDGLHVGVAYAISETDAGVLHIMNPWRGFDHVQPVAWWRQRLGIGVWPVMGPAHSGGGTTQMQVPDGWHDDGTTLTASNGVAVVKGFRALVLASAWNARNLPLRAEVGDPTSSYQAFSDGIATWHMGEQPVYVACPALVAALAPQAIPDRYSKALAAIDALAAAVAADKAA